ncbi:hypothetical protein Ddye_005602 [Dipteronia dyeriana]|uniref:Uncharacterized protein n=1 Tax=Dipteronia dyeriana TaxID=168575 RepID=A0AAD9XGM3_9ROSI|nr:hypothetical protein Ddye_005602 [Dipteronia dyeriana]
MRLESQTTSVHENSEVQSPNCFSIKSIRSCKSCTPSKAREQITVLSRSKITQPGLRKPIERCIPWYDSAVRDFNVSTRELVEDPMSANYDAGVAGIQAYYCENGFVFAQLLVPAEIASLNEKLWSFSRIAEAVTDTLQQDYS